MKNFTSLIYLLLAISIVSCKKKGTLDATEVLTVCGTKDPLKNIAWINAAYLEIASQPTVNGIALYKYNNNEIIEVQYAHFSSTNQHQYFCDGTKLNFNNQADFSKYRQERKFVGMLFGTNIWDNLK